MDEYLTFFFFLSFIVRAESSHTVGVEFGSKVADVGGKRIKLQIWDTGKSFMLIHVDFYLLFVY